MTGKFSFSLYVGSKIEYFEGILKKKYLLIQDQLVYTVHGNSKNPTDCNLKNSLSFKFFKTKIFHVLLHEQSL